MLSLLILLHTFILPNVVQVCEYNTRALITGMIDKAVTEQLDKLADAADYGSLINVTYNDDGRVTSIQSKTAVINLIRTAILDDVNERLMRGDVISTQLSVGTLSGISAFYGSGGYVEMTVEPTGYADAVFISEFSDAGINQTLHRIIMRTTVSATAFIPLYSVQTEVSGDFLIAETVIVGDIPESYTHIISVGTDPVEDLFNYS
ncbi:MAG: sporulation protein YunB [Eubacterium sp.]|nr:sporulation protein YunB [Eubacterium sp.]